jgi:hypothetical protein
MTEIVDNNPTGFETGAEPTGPDGSPRGFFGMNVVVS